MVLRALVTTHALRRAAATAVVALLLVATGAMTGPTASAAPPAAGILAIIAGQESVCGAPVPGPATSSDFCGIGAVAVDGTGNLYVADPNNNAIEKVTPSGTLSVFAGRGSTNPTGCTTLSPCVASQVQLFEPDGVAADGAGNVYIADFADHLVEKVTPAGSLSVFAGTGTSGAPTPGPATSSKIGAPNGVGADAAGDVFIADSGEFVEKVTPSGTLSIFAGTGSTGAPTPGPATASKLNVPNAVALDASGNAYIADVANNEVEKVTPSGTLSVFAGTGTGGAPTPGPATGSKLSNPEGVVVDGSGNVYIADASNQVVEKVTPSGTLSVVAGTGVAGASTAGPATSSKLRDPGSVATDTAGNLYIADSDNSVVAEVGAPAQKPAFTAASPPPTTPGVPYSYRFVASGNPPPTFAVTSGSPPAGLTLDPTTGVLAGTPTGPGTFAVTATNTAGSAVAGPFSLGATTAPGGAGVAATPDGTGYWVVGSDGAITPHGSAVSFGSLAGTRLAAPVVGIAATADGAGYWLVAADGGVFTFGDARFYGSEAGRALTQPMVDIAPTADGAGYWLVAADGGVFTFGDAAFSGSEGSTRLDKPMVGIVTSPDAHGYWLVAADGGVFSLGDARFSGSEGAKRIDAPVVGMAATADGAGYWLVASDGGVFTFGDAGFHGSGFAAGKTVMGILPTPSGTGYLLIDTGGNTITV